MSSLLCLPREIRDEILYYVLLPDILDEAHLINQTEPSYREFPLNLIRSSNPNLNIQRWNISLIKPICPALFLVNHQIAAEAKSTIDRCKDLRSCEILVEIIEEERITTRWLQVPTYDCFNIMDKLQITIRISPDYQPQWTPSPMFVLNWELEGVRALIPPFDKILSTIRSVLRMRPFPRHSGASQTFFIKDIAINIETPKGVAKERFGPPLEKNGSRPPVSRRWSHKNHVLDPNWLAEKLVTNALPKYVLNDFYVASRDMFSGSIFERVDRISVLRDGKPFRTQDGTTFSLCTTVVEALVTIYGTHGLIGQFHTVLIRTSLKKFIYRVQNGMEMDESLFSRLTQIWVADPGLMTTLAKALDESRLMRKVAN